jgi:hypothetical protein
MGGGNLYADYEWEEQTFMRSVSESLSNLVFRLLLCVAELFFKCGRAILFCSTWKW